MNWCIFEGVSPEIVYTSSFGGDKKPLVSGVLLTVSIQMLFPVALLGTLQSGLKLSCIANVADEE